MNNYLVQGKNASVSPIPASKRVHFSPYAQDGSFNDRALASMSNSSANFGKRTAAETQDARQRQSSSVQPGDWLNLDGQNLNKSANVGQKSMKLPDKLLKFRDRVKRDRSANMARDQSREDSLYGRRKAAGDIDRECQKLRESYGKHRKLSTQSNNGLATELLQKQNFKEDPFDRDGSFYAQRSRGSASFDRNLGVPETMRVSDKENGFKHSNLRGSLQEPDVSQSQTQLNKYKRTQQKSLQTLANYQQKYERLEKNFKKFSNNIRHATQSEQIIDDLRSKTGLSLIFQSAKKKQLFEQRAAFRQWRVNSGVALKQYENQEKLLIMARCCQKMQSKLRNHVKIQFYQKWKQITFSSNSSSGLSANSKEKIASVLSDLITNSDNFNRCIENDKYLSLILSSKLQEIFQQHVLAIDMLFFNKSGAETLGEEDCLQGLKVYHDLSGEQVDFNNDQIVGQSVLGRVLTHQQPIFDAQWHPISVVESIQSDPDYNSKIDDPVNIERLMHLNSTQTNVFNKVKGLGSVFINFEAPLRLGILRLFFESSRNYNQRATDKHMRSSVSIAPLQQLSLTTFQLRLIKNLTEVLPQFIQRIFEVRTQINSLAITSMDQQEQMREMENINCINQKVREIQRRMTDIQDKESLLETVREEVERALSDGVGGFDMDGIMLKQIVLCHRDQAGAKEEHLLTAKEQPDKDLVRYYDHYQEDEEIVEDFLDHKKDYYVHQISICPKIPTVGQSSVSVGASQALPTFGCYTFVLQMQLKYPQHASKNKMSLALSPGSKILSHAVHEQSAISAQVNPLNSFIGQTINYAQSLPKRQSLDPILKHRLSLYFRSLAPILMQSLRITSQLIPQVTQLERSLQLRDERTQIADWLGDFCSAKSLTQQLDPVVVHLELKEAIKHVLLRLQLVDSEEDGELCLLLDQSTVSRPQFWSGHWHYKGLMNDEETRLFDDIVIQRYKDLFGSKQAQKLSLITQKDHGLNEVNVEGELLPKDPETRGEHLLLPIRHPTNPQLMGYLIFRPTNFDGDLAQKQAMLTELLGQSLGTLSHQRHAYQALQEQHNRLLQQLEGEQVTQEAKDLINLQLIIPYARKPTLKCLGDGIDALADKLVTNDFDRVGSTQSEAPEFGQEVNQIAYFNKGIYVEDVRLYSAYNQFKDAEKDGKGVRSREPNAPDEMLLQSFAQQQQIVYEDEVLDKVVMLYPFVNSHTMVQSVNLQRSMNQSLAGLCASQQGLVLRFVLDRDNYVQEKLQNINTQLINVIQPVVLAILQGGVMTKEKLALQKLAQVVDRQKSINYRELLYCLRDLKAKNVYNFTRSSLYAKLAKSKRYMELKHQLNRDLDEVKGSQRYDHDDRNNPEFFDLQLRRLNENQQIQFLIRQALKVINAQAFKYKQSCFRRFVIGTRQDVYAKMSKKKKKATCALATMYSYVVMRRHLNKLAINTKTFKYVRNPRAKAVGAALCLFRNFRVVRERLGFLKLKKNLNLQLRASMTSSQESDKDLFIQLNQILLSSFSQEGGLDGALSYALGEVFSYIKSLTKKELYVKDMGRNVADDAFAGHIDEVIISVKSGVFQSGGGHTGNILSAGNAAQKSRIFICRFPNARAKKAPGILRINDSNLDIDDQLTHQEQLLNQIEANNAQLGDEDRNAVVAAEDSEHVGEGENYGCPFQKYVINSKRDLINLMLTKSNGIIFNFQNIQQSLSDIFLSQQSRHKDQNIGNRFSTVKRSKSALIIPMFDVSQANIIGSFELYRHHQQIFATEMEARFEYFSKRLADFILLYGQLKAQHYQIEQLRLQMEKSIRPAANLSALLKNVYLNAPNNHFPGAAHVLPIIILNTVGVRVNDGLSARSLSQNSNYQEIFSESGQIGAHMQQNDGYSYRRIQQKLAFFYQFKDNHIYNFEYDGTFIDEIMENKCILEMCPKNAMLPDEGPDNRPNRSQPFHGIDNNFDLHSSTMSVQSGYQGGRSVHQGSQRMEGNSIEKVHSVTNEAFKHIVYYPVFDVHDEQRIIAILEVGFKKYDKKVNYQGLSSETQHYLDQFRSHLDQFRIRLSSFCRSMEGMCTARAEKRKARMFQIWKNATNMAQCRDQFLESQQQALRSQEQCYNEYMQNLDNFNAQLQNAHMEKERLHQQIDQFSVEKRAKLKFLATSLVSSQNLFHKLQRQQKRQAFTKWQFNVSIRKIAEAAFTRVLQVNHKHAKARLRTGVFLLKQLADRRAVSTAFHDILQAAHMRRHNFRGDRYGFGPGPAVDYSSADCAGLRLSKTRASAGGNESFILNNITSLLSPQNMKKIEQKNLYQKHINSLYQPHQSINHSAVTNTRQMNFVTANDGQSLPLIQLKPDEVVRDLGSTQMASTQDQSRFTVQAAELKHPSTSNLDFLRTDTRVISRYSNNSVLPGKAGERLEDNLNRSQIELSRGKRDYSPILTTSKYDIKSIYDPLGKFQSATGSAQRILKKRNRSTNSQALSLKRHGGSLVNGPTLKRGKSSMRTTKCELQKQLYIKQKQLTLLRKQIDHEAQGKKEGRERQPRFGSKDRSNHSMEDQRRSVKGSLLQDAKQSTPVPDVHNSLSICKPSTKFDDQLGNSFEKYAKINGRDVSPPVRLNRKIEPELGDDN